MTEAPKIEEIRAALGGDPRIGFPGVPIKISILEQAVVLEGEVRDVAAKKVALEQVAAVRGVGGIVDRLHVAPAEQQADAEITDRVKDAFLQEPAFREVALRTMDKGRLVAQYEPIGARGKIDIEVGDGVVTLNGTLSGLERKRLAGVLAWWVPGSRDVVNGIVVEPPEVDTDGLMREAVHLVLEKDPFVDASQIAIQVRDARVTLRGIVPSPSEKRMAEADAWYVFAVDDVANELEVRP